MDKEQRSFGDVDEFVAWLGQEKDASRFRYAGLSEPETLTLAISPPPVGECDPARQGRFCPVVLPASQHARQWWQQLWDEQEVIDFWIFEDWGTMSLLVAAKAGVWSPSDTLHAKLALADYHRIDYAKFRSLVDTATATHMMNEISLAGFSTRQLDLSSRSRSNGKRAAN